MQNNNKGTIVFTAKFIRYNSNNMKVKWLMKSTQQQQQHSNNDSNSRIRILAIWIQIFFVFRNWRRLQHITELSSWIIYSLQLLLQGATMFIKILLGQMPKWDKKLHSRWKQEKPHWKSIHMRLSLKLKIVSLAVSRP